jgi:rhodanese-related sulfurtransferase
MPNLRYRDAVTPDPVTVADIDPEEASRFIGTGAFLLDVREDDEWEAGHAPQAVHVAMGLVTERIDEIPADRTVVCVCRVGGRSGAVAGALAGAGYDVRNVDGGMLAWEAGGLPVVTDGGHAGRII